MAINITEDIRDLLYENELVIIHGLGMITASYQGAQINEAEQTIAPPSLKYSFDNRIKESDGLLEKMMEKKYNLSEEQSLEVVKRFKDQVFSILEKHKKIVIQGVGKMQREGDKIVLNAYEGTEDPISYALPEISLKKSIAGTVNSHLQQTSQHESHQSESAEHTSSNNSGSAQSSRRKENKNDAGNLGRAEVNGNSAQDRSDKNKKRRKKSVFPWILVLLLALSFLVVLFSGLYLLNDNVSGFVQKLLNQEKKENIMDREDDRASESSIKSMDDETPVDEEASSPENMVTDSDNADCVVIVGLFKDQDNARRISKKIEARGYELYRRSLASGDQLGLYTSCSNYNEALDFAKGEIASDAFLKNLRQ